MAKIKEIYRELLADCPLLTLDRDTLGEVRVQGHRVSVSNVLTALVLEGNGLSLMLEEYDWRLTEAEVLECLRFASAFLHKTACDKDLFPDADLNEFERND